MQTFCMYGMRADLHSSEQSHSCGVIDNTLPKNKTVQQRAAVLLQHLKHGHRVSCSKDDAQR